jgi:replicative DNA helicase Mcm
VESLLKEHSGKVIQGKDCLILKMGSFEKNIITTDWSTIFSTKIDRVSKHVAPSEFIEITAANGRKIVVTPEHPTFCIDNAQIITKRADEITTASWIPTPLQIPIAGEQQQFSVKQEDIYNPLASQHIAVPVHNDKAFFKIIGYVLAEGSKERNRGKLIGVNFTNKDKHVLNDFKICMKEFFGISPYIQERKDDSEPRWMLRYISRELAEFLKETVPEMLEASAKKTIPEIAMKGTKDNIAAMLSCMFEGDGHVSKKQRTIRVGFGSNSRRMCEQVQDLLLRFSIRSNLTEHKKSYKISITGYDNLLRFDRYIGFRTDSKNQIVREYLDKTNFCIIRTVKDVIPNCQEELIGLLKKYGQSIVRHNKLATMKHDYLVKGKNISRKLLQKAVEQLESVTKPEDFDKVVNLRKLAWAEIGFERVRRVRRIRNETQKWVYDVTIDPNHAFVSQNMILHNTVSISKANIQATLRAETTVLAAANPKFGRFDPYGNIADQIDLPSTLINRFDLIFPIKDLPDAQKDDRMAEFILNLHQNPNAEQPEVATKMIRKYIAYAKQNVKPQLTEAANEEIKAYYLKMRASGAQEGAVKSIPISPRQLEGLIRLSEAVARVRLSDKVTKKDAKRAVRLLDYCLRQIAMDEETGTIDIDRIATGIPATQRSRIMIIKEIISDLENKLGNKIPVEDIIRMATEKGIDESEVDSVIEKLKRSGDVFEPRHGLISKL